MINAVTAVKTGGTAIRYSEKDAIKEVLQNMNGCWVGVHDFKREMFNLLKYANEGEKEPLINTLKSLAKKLKTIGSKIEIIPKTKNGEIPAFPNDSFATREYYLVKNGYPNENIGRYVRLFKSENNFLPTLSYSALRLSNRF